MISLRTPIFTVLLASLLFFATVQVSFASGMVGELEGYAWSSTIGWISMNCDQTGVGGSDTCGAVDYRVQINADYSVTGHAWSPNIGWIQFGGLSGFPTGAGTQSSNVSNDPVGLRGWARACAGTQAGDCSTMTSRTDGWDGWISLRGDLYGVDFTGREVSTTASRHFAWGSTVVGWVDFAPTTAGPVRIKIEAPTVTILSPSTPQPFGPVVITFDPISGGDAPDSCTISDGVTTNPITLSSPVTSAESITVTPTADTTYTIECQNSAGSSSDTVSVAFIYDLMVGVVPTVGTVGVLGSYDTVGYQLQITGVPASANNVPYTIALAGQPTITGTFDGSSAVGGVVTFTRTFTNVPIAATPQNWTVTVDAPTPGVVPEGGGAAEINEASGTLNLPAPNPTVTIDTESIVRSGTEAYVSITVSSVVGYSCTVYGPGLTGTAPVISSPTGASQTVNLTTDPLFNSTAIVVECAVIGAPTPYRQRASIEVTPAFQEI